MDEELSKSNTWIVIDDDENNIILDQDYRKDSGLKDDELKNETVRPLSRSSLPGEWLDNQHVMDALKPVQSGFADLLQAEIRLQHDSLDENYLRDSTNQIENLLRENQIEKIIAERRERMMFSITPKCELPQKINVSNIVNRENDDIKEGDIKQDDTEKDDIKSCSSNYNYDTVNNDSSNLVYGINYQDVNTFDAKICKANHTEDKFSSGLENNNKMNNNELFNKDEVRTNLENFERESFEEETIELNGNDTDSKEMSDSLNYFYSTHLGSRERQRQRREQKARSLHASTKNSSTNTTLSTTNKYWTTEKGILLAVSHLCFFAMGYAVGSNSITMSSSSSSSPSCKYVEGILTNCVQVDQLRCAHE